MAKVKDIYSDDFIKRLANELHKATPLFNADKFLLAIYSDDWNKLEFKQRVSRLSTAMYQTLPNEYEESLAVLKGISPKFQGLSGIIFPDYVEKFGLKNWNESIQALEYFTKFSTSEFAIRAFILLEQDSMLRKMFQWSNDVNEHVRRLASEGCRPRLPWGQSLPSFKEDPSPLLPLLMNLIRDDSLYVRKSVANNLNDISKTHPEVIIDIVKQEYGKDPRTDWILRHASRTLLKQGNKKALALFGYEANESTRVTNLNLDKTKLSIGESLSYSFQIVAEKTTKIRIEYAIDYIKKNQKRSRKIFKVSEIELKEGQIKTYSRNQSFKNMTTRVHYPGDHTISILINGEEKISCNFTVTPTQ
ncbi:DNA alkylation repair protein [Salipaludibacillus sp. CF4.18]|uniref:DNA alkylation repair protein n=1 Tax=Salipaludibacillus sp. CF4.18 TaxID=3373081 RepID=UPI003EE476DD